MGLLDNAPNVLRAAGLQVVELPGWRDRGETDGGFLNLGIFYHHDAMGLGFRGDPSQFFNVPQFMSQNGNDGSQFWVARPGVWYILANGRKWHAGLGQGWGKIPADDGNTYCCAMETDHRPGDPWEPQMLDSINRGCRALAIEYGWDVDNYCCGHKEYAPDRKIDPDMIDLNAWRAFMKSSNPVPPVTNPGGFGTMDDPTINAKFAAQDAKLDAILNAINVPDKLKPVLNVADIGEATTETLRIVNKVYNNTISLLGFAVNDKT